MQKDWKNKIYYSQCWEDPFVLAEGLAIGENDTVLSVTSGGCNTLTLLLDNPNHVVAVDVNSAQNYLLELKMAAIRSLQHDELLAFLGVQESKDRISVYKSIEVKLSQEARTWWDANCNLIEMGILHCGKFEKYFGFFRNTIMPLVHSRRTIRELFRKKSRQEQELFYQNNWNTWRWRLIFKIFFSKTIMSRASRNPHLFEYVRMGNISDYYFKKAEQVFRLDPSMNFFLQYIFLGNYLPDSLPPYLRKGNVEKIKSKLDRIDIVSADVGSFLGRSAEKFSKFNLSNIFESLSVEETNEIFQSLVSNAKKGSRAVYINHLVERSYDASMTNMTVLSNEALITSKNLGFFYKKVHIVEIN